MSRKALFMETTKVSAANTAAEIVKLLVAGGARSVHMNYDEHRKIVGIDFVFKHGTIEFPFSIPARVNLLFDKLWTARATQWEADRPKVLAQAERVAWRQLLRWVEAQIALVDSGMVSNVEVFTPYLQIGGGRSVFDAVIEQGFKALPPGKR